jgi:CheY-like chemotaxis protein/anti-sigma regulatory factor (Ser/Thr protein kinase)
LNLAPRTDDFVGVVRDTLAGFAPQLTGKAPVVLRTDIEPTLPPRLVFDVLRTRQILMNLVSNALKFTDRGEVVVTVRHVATVNNTVALTLAVRDTGRGMSAEQQAKLFVPYQQADAQIAQSYGGTGLGLTLVKRLVSAMGGQIALDSEVNQGTTVTLHLTLPVAAPDTTLASVNTPPHANALRVLVADDTRLQQMLIAGELQALGCIVDCANDGKEALALWRTHQHQLLVIDQRMPGMDGIALVRAVRAAATVPQPMVVMATADADNPDIGLAAGANAVLQKPLSRTVLGDFVARVTRSAKPE